MDNYQFDPRFADRQHGDNIYINQLYVHLERLRMIRYSDTKVEEERRRLLSEIENFLSSLDNQSMRIVVAGGFNAGKSTFINALINRNLMPAYAKRTTGTINCLVTGEREEWVIFRRNGQKETRTYQDADHLRSQLKAIMEKESDSTDHIEIVCPGHAFLKRFTLIDTPGLDHNQQDSIISLHQIERADALIWVLHNGGLCREDNDNLQRFKSANPNSPVIIIINQIDTLESDELEDVVRTVRNKLQNQVDQIFPFSAKLAFEGQNKKDQVKIAQSNFYELQDYLHSHFFSKYHDLKKLHLNKFSQLLLNNLKDFEFLSCKDSHTSMSVQIAKRTTMINQKTSCPSREKNIIKELSRHAIDDLVRQFEAGLAKIKYEFQKNLLEIDPLDKNALEKMLTVFNQRLVIFQHEFLEYLAKVRGGVNPRTENFNVEEPPINRIPEVAASILAMSGGALLVSIIPVGTSGWWIWATTVTAAASIGSAVGAPAGFITAGVGIIAGAVGSVGIALCMRKYRRKLIYSKLVLKFDDEVAPRLRKWAEAKISE